MAASVLYIAAIVLFFCFDQSANNKIWIFLGALAMCVLTVVAWQDTPNTKRTVALATGIFLMLLIAVWSLPIPPAWGAIPIFLIGEFVLIAMKVPNDKIYLAPVLIALVAAWAML